MRSNHKTIAFLLAALLLGFSRGLPAQEITGTLSGTVTDTSGAIVPDATVIVVRTETGAVRQTTTSSAGIFFFNSLPIGSYRMSVEKAGFKKYEASGIELHVNDKLDLPVQLTVGEIAEKVTVTLEAPLLQTESAELASLVSSKQILDLPLNGRDFNQLVDLVPGVAPDNGRVNGGVGLFSDTSVSVSGSQSNSNLFLVDGEYNLDSGGNGNLLVTPSVDSIEEFKILRNDYSAEFGGATGGVINVVTKSGGSNFHGTVYDFVRNDKLDATDTFLNASGQQKSKLRQNDYGFTGGGPFWIPGVYNTKRTSDFFFVSMEWRHESRGNVVTDTVPTLRQRQGILDPACAVTPPAPCTIQPADPQELVLTEPNIAAGLIDPNAAAFLQRYPLPNANIAGGFNFIASPPRVNTDMTQLYRWDHSFGSRYVFAARYIGMTQSLNGINCDLFGACDNFPSVNTDWTWKGKSAIVKLTAQLTSRLINDFQFGYSSNELGYVTGATSDPAIAGRAGFTYTELFPETSGSFPALNGVNGFGAIGNGAPFHNRTDNFQYKDDLAYTTGKHNFKFGGFLRFNRKTEPANGGSNYTAGTFTFDTFENFLLGNFTNYNEEQTQNNVYDRERDYAFYANDTWKLRPNLTLSLGLRYQVLAQIFSATNNISNFRVSAYNPGNCSVAAFDAAGNVDPTLCSVTNGIVVPGTGGVSRSTLPSHYNDWEPRLGLAWQPGAVKNLVVRAGLGIFAGRDALSQTSSLGRQLPNDIVANISGGSFSSLAAFNFSLPQPPAFLFALADPYDSPTTYQYNLGAQYQLGSKTVFDVSYVGNHGIHLGRNRNINQVPDASRLNVLNGVVLPDTVRPFLGYNVINYNERAGVSRYNSLQISVDRRLAHGFQIQGSYTYSRNITNTANQDTEAAFAPVQNAFNTAGEKGLANQDTPHSLSINYSWELPFFAQTHGIARQALQGWKFVGIATFRSGTPTNICLSQDVAGTGTGGGAYECQRPDLIANPNLDKGARTLAHYFNTDAFVQPAAGAFGNAGRNVLRQPGVNNWDLSIFKAFEFPWFGKHQGWAAAETAKLEFRGELFNAFNHAQYNSLDTSFVVADPINGAGSKSASPTFGAVTGDRGPREIQFALKLIF
ncbi:MAG: TonB-dependent receptor [Acidobacteriia bacterium]|nr:TonB-dependent receptor [Terriglobia bacterium]